MAESSRRASRAGRANAVFVVAAAERLPAELQGLADELTILFPWGSLLRGALALDDAAAASAGIASLLAPGGVATAFVSIEDRDNLGLPHLDAEGACEALRKRWSRHGLELCALRPATPAELAATRSTWARRLAAGRYRVAWRIELRAFGRQAGSLDGPTVERADAWSPEQPAPSTFGSPGGPSVGGGPIRDADTGLPATFGPLHAPPDGQAALCDAETGPPPTVGPLREPRGGLRTAVGVSPDGSRPRDAVNPRR